MLAMPTLQRLQYLDSTGIFKEAVIGILAPVGIPKSQNIEQPALPSGHLDPCIHY